MMLMMALMSQRTAIVVVVGNSIVVGGTCNIIGDIADDRVASTIRCIITGRYAGGRPCVVVTAIIV